jgi:hypothetical protein
MGNNVCSVESICCIFQLLELLVFTSKGHRTYRFLPTTLSAGFVKECEKLSDKTWSRCWQDFKYVTERSLNVLYQEVKVGAFKLEFSPNGHLRYYFIFWIVTALLIYTSPFTKANVIVMWRIRILLWQLNSNACGQLVVSCLINSMHQCLSWYSLTNQKYSALFVTGSVSIHRNPQLVHLLS